MDVRKEIVDYIIANSPDDPRIIGPRDKEVQLFHDVLLEMNDMVVKLKDMTHKAGVWQGKYTDCKNTVTILRKRKNFYKSMVQSIRKEYDC